VNGKPWLLDDLADAQIADDWLPRFDHAREHVRVGGARQRLSEGSDRVDDLLSVAVGIRGVSR